MGNNVTMPPSMKNKWALRELAIDNVQYDQKLSEERGQLRELCRLVMNPPFKGRMLQA